MASDIRETGYQNYRQLQLLNEQEQTQLKQPTFEELQQYINKKLNLSAAQLNQIYTPLYSEPVGMEAAYAGFGNSIYDKLAVSDWDFLNLGQIRATSQSGLTLLGNGLIKRFTTGISTFLDDTVGFLYGMGVGAFNVAGLNGTNENGTNKTFLLGLWQNSINESLNNFLDYMEEVAPNYYTYEELEDPWYKLILSANFIGDKMMKNQGFSEGALGAMMVTKGLGVGKFAGAVAKGTTKFTIGGLGKMFNASRGTLGKINSFARTTGNIADLVVLGAIGASGEASIEAINAVKESGKDIYLNLEKRRLNLINSLDSDSPDYLIRLNAIDAATEQYKQKIDTLLRDVGNSVYALNMGILSLSNTLEFAPILRGGFQRSSKLTNYVINTNNKLIPYNLFVQSLLRGEPVTVENTFNKGWGKIAAITAKTSLIEGTEEGLQNLASNTALMLAKAKLNLLGETTLLGNRINPESSVELADYTKAFIKTLYDNFGKPESKGWEEFFLGALTGAKGSIGLSPHIIKDSQGNPIINSKGKIKTSWKPRSISDLFLGGIWLARRLLLDEYEQHQVLVDAINKKLADPEFIKRTQHAVAVIDFESGMRQALDSNDLFEFKNSEIGKLVNDVFFFRDKGMIDDYKDIYRNLTSIDDQTLQQLYAATSDLDGNTQLSLEDMQSVRKEYENKALKTLDKIKMILDYYDYVDLEYRDRSPLFKEELAYQYIRLDDTRRRINELEEKGKLPSKIKSILLEFADATAEQNLNINSNLKEEYVAKFPGLTESELEDLKRLRRLEKQYQRRINRAKENPWLIDWSIQRTYNEAERKYNSLNAQDLIAKIKNAKTVAEVNLILASADESISQKVLNTAYQEGDSELKQKLQDLISATTAFDKTKSRLKKAGWRKEDAKQMEDLIQNLLYRVYISNNLNLKDIKNVLNQIHLELQEDSVATIAEYMPNVYGIFESKFIGENNKLEKAILLDVLEGAIEEIGYGIMAGEDFKLRQEINARTKKLQQQEEQKKLLQEEKKKLSTLSFKDAVNNTKYVKLIEGINLFQKEFENIGVSEIEQAISDTIGDYEISQKAVKSLLLAVKSVVANPNPLKRLDELISKNKGKNLVIDSLFENLSQIIKKSSSANKTSSKNTFKSLKDLLKKADKNKDADKVNSIVDLILANVEEYKLQGATNNDIDYIVSLKNKYKRKKTSSKSSDAQYADYEVTSETTERNGIKTTKFTMWRNNTPATNGGLKIDINTIDTKSFDTDDVEKVVLTELREKDGKFSGTIIYSVKGLKNREKAEVLFTRDPRENVLNTHKKLDNSKEKLAGNKIVLNDGLEYIVGDIASYGGSKGIITAIQDNGVFTVKWNSGTLAGQQLNFTKNELGAILLERSQGNLKPLKQVESKQSFKNVLAGSTYVKQIKDVESHLKLIERFGVKTIDEAIGNVIEEVTPMVTNSSIDTVTKNIIKYIGLIVTADNYEEKLETLKKAIESYGEKNPELLYIADEAQKLINNMLEVEEEEEELKPTIILASSLEVQSLLEKFYEEHSLDPVNLSSEEQQSIIDNLKKALELVNKKTDIPLDLQIYANIILENKLESSVVVELNGTPSAISSNANELNGIYRGLYDTGNVAEGRANSLQQMLGVMANEDALEANYETVEHAAQVQWCVDNILKDLQKENIPIKLISTVNTTYNTGLRITYTAVRADEKLKSGKKIRDIAKVRWLVTTNEGDYIIIGTLGYNSSNSEQESYWNLIRLNIDELIKNIQPTHEYYVSNNDLHLFKINNIGDGRPVKTHYQHTGTRSIIELINGPDKGRNPQGLTLRDLKWQIIYDNTEVKSVNVGRNDRIRGKANLGSGKVYILVPSPSGVYYRHPVSPITISEVNKESTLYKKVDNLIESIIKDVKTKENKINDVLKLKNLLVLERKSAEESYLDIYFNDNGIRVRYKPREGIETSIILDENKDTAIQLLKDIIYNSINPFISVTLAHLNSPASIEMLDNAGALQLKEPLAIFSYVGSNYTVVPFNTTTNSKLEKRQRTSLEIQEEEFLYNGRVFKRDGQYYRNDILITDPLEIETLNDVNNINSGIYTAETLYKWRKIKQKWLAIPMEGNYYFIQKGSLTTVYHKDVHGNITKVDSKEVNKLLDARKKKSNIETRSMKNAEVAEELDFEIDTTGAEELDEETKDLFRSEKKAKNKLEESKESSIIEIDVPTTTGEVRKEKVQKVKPSELKEGDLIWYSGTESENPIDQDTILTIDGDKVWGNKGLHNAKAIYKVVTSESTSKESKEDKEVKIEARKQDAINRAIYDLKLLKNIKVGDLIALEDGENKRTIVNVVWDEAIPASDINEYAYSDIPGSVRVVIKTLEGGLYDEDIYTIFHLYQKVNILVQKSLKDLDISENSSTFVENLKNTAVDISAQVDILYEKAAAIAKEKGIVFDDNCTIDELVSWYRDNVGFNLNTIPSNASPKIIEELIENCK